MAQTVGDLTAAFLEWLGTRAASTTVRLVAPSAGPLPEGAGVLLHRVSPRGAERRCGEAQAIEVSLLIVVNHADALEAATIAGELAFGLSDEIWIDAEGVARHFIIAQGDDADTARRALGLPACLATLIRLPLVRERPRRAVKPVLEPLRVEMVEFGAMEGAIMGEVSGVDPRPVMDARVEAEAYGREARTDRNGRFRLTGVPAQGTVALTVTAKGRSRSFSVKERSGVLLRLPINGADEEPVEGRSK
ncbi:carboxypeptidase-like regulatory domain-containing protein [Methylocapsa acidiphila]|uniref:carboxypeptidase-like regulatory domain-containing protein n=1 Tax=Methylocapsa acidiphila TaxID=133552 RepID=UPI00040BEC03|nr:carboxypeptidase-like regulatory domain-containing protein [Methylocapsa acidiphila]